MGKKKKQAVVKPALTARVTCDAGHPLTGLFVVFKLVPPDGESPQEKLARVVEATPHPGDPPAEPEATGDKKADGEAQKAYKKAKKDYDAALKRYEDAPDKETPPDPADQFVLGIVDGKGFLQPVHTRYNPWYDVATGRDPDTYKMAAGEKYEVCALRHPSPAMARALTRHLNRAAAPDDKKYGFSSWGTLTRVVTIEGGGEGGAQPTMRLSESAADYVPRGSSRYDDWMLYRDMPHERCEPLKGPVLSLQDDLAKLRYPVGDSGSPFVAMPYDPGADKPHLRGGFSGQVQAAVARFQEHVQEGKAFLLADKDAAHGGNVWSYVLGAPFDRAAPTDPGVAWDPLPAGFALGVVDPDTADRIAHWIDKGLRKPPEILVQSTVSSYIWMLERGVVALDAWSLFAEAFGVRYGVKPGSSLRSILVGAWPGAIKHSVHKTGLAVDLAGGAQRVPNPSWPIRYEAHWKKNEREAASAVKAAEKQVADAQKRVDDKAALEAELAAETDPRKKKNLEKKLAGKTYAGAEADLEKAKIRLERARGDDADSKFYWKQRWRLYGHSDLAVFDPTKRDAEIARLKKQIAALAGLPDPGSADPPPEGGGPPRGKLWKQFRDKRFKGAGGAAAEAWLDKVLKPYADYAASILKETPEKLIDTYFRSSVVQWHPNAYEGDGGTSGKKYGPKAGDDEFPAATWAESWVNLSAIGYLCQLERIGPHTNDIRDQTWVLGPKDPDAAPVWRPMLEYFTASDDESKDIVYLLSDITATEADAPQLKQRDTDVPVRRDGKVIATYKPSEIDGKLVKEWRLKAEKLDRSLFAGPAKKGHSTVARGPELVLILSAGEAKKAIFQKAIDLIGGTFAAKSFVVVRAGELAKVDVGQGEIVTGKDLAERLTAAQEAFIAQATAFAKQKAEEEQAAKEQAEKEAEEARLAGQKPPRPKKKTSAEIRAEKKAAEEAAKKLVTDWTVVLQPIFLNQPDPALISFLADDEVLLPPGSEAGHLEWWHYQHVSASPSWGELLQECGYSPVVMGTPMDGPADADGLPVHRGLSYTAKELGSHPGGFREGPVENRDTFTPPGG